MWLVRLAPLFLCLFALEVHAFDCARIFRKDFKDIPAEERPQYYRIVNDDIEAQQIRVDLIHNAKREILSSYFIFGDDYISLSGLALFRAAARRGVKVKLIVDAHFNRISPALRAHLLEEGIEIRVYHPLRFSWTGLKRFFRRLHDKILEVDGVYLLTGGRNVKNSYFGRAKRNYLDRDVLHVGSQAGKSRKYYLEMWESDHVSPVKVKDVSRSAIKSAAQELDYALWQLSKSDVIQIGSGRDWLKDERPVRTVAFYHSIFRSDGTRFPLTTLRLRELLQKAEKEILIETPYLIPSEAFKNDIREAFARGVTRIRILTNSLAAADHVLAFAGYDKYKQELLDLGVELWEYQGPETLHAKSAVIDGKIAVIGTYNLDPRSENLNSEVALMVQDVGKARELEVSFEEHLYNSFRIGSDGRVVGMKKRYPGVSFRRVCLMKCLRYLVVPVIEGQL